MLDAGAGEDWESLRAQRYRWRRGLLQVLWRHRRVIANPRYGVVGLPFTTLFEGQGPLPEDLARFGGRFEPYRVRTRYGRRCAIIANIDLAFSAAI